MEHKLLSLSDVDLKFAGDKGTFSGYASVFNGVDSYGDTIVPGAYKKTLKNRQRPVMMRWQHYGPVIGKWTAMGEDEKGLWMEGELTPGHSLAADVYASMKHGAVNGLSIGFRPVQVRELGDGRRELKEIDLVEVSIVEEPADLSARVGNVKAASEGAIKNAAKWLQKAIKLHEGHMDGSVDTTEKSQKEMMTYMEKALSFLVGEPGASMAGHGKNYEVQALNSLKEIEDCLRDAGGFSRSAAKAMVSQFKHLVLRDAASEGKDEAVKAISQAWSGLKFGP